MRHSLPNDIANVCVIYESHKFLLVKIYNPVNDNAASLRWQGGGVYGCRR